MEENSTGNRHRLSIVLLLAGFILGPLFMTQEARTAGSPLQLSAGFDNPRVEQNETGIRYLEALVSTERGPALRHARPQLPLNIALVIDCSGSMQQQNKLETVKESALSILDRLRPGDRFALVTYSQSAEVRIPSTAMEDLSEARSIIMGLEPGGGTNLGEGLQTGYSQLRRYASPATLNRVFLLSDGLANTGITASGQLSEIAAAEAAGNISLSTFGVGVEFNEQLMADLSEFGHGMYYFIEEAPMIQEALTQEFLAARAVIARDVQFTLQLDPRLEVEKVFANSYQIDGSTVRIQMGDLSAGELRRLQLRVRTPELRSGNHEVGTVLLRYRDGESNTLRHEEKALVLNSGRFGSRIADSRDTGITERSLVFEARYARDNAAHAFDQGSAGEARRILEKSIALMEQSAQKSRKIQEELGNSKEYLNSLQNNLDHKARAQKQKAVRFQRYRLEGC